MKIEIEKLKNTMLGYECLGCYRIFPWLSAAINHIEDNDFECPNPKEGDPGDKDD